MPTPETPHKNPAKHVALEKLVRIPMVFLGGGMFLLGISSPKTAGEEILETLGLRGPLQAKGCKMDHPYSVYEEAIFMEGYMYIYIYTPGT